MSKKTKEQNLKNRTKKKGITREYIESFLIALGIALVIRALVIYPFRIPTASMEGSLLVGDFLLANKFVYGIRTPDWIGIPYTKVGFDIPFLRTPGFRKPRRGDVVIFKYPRDESLNYIKRCIGVSGDSIEIRDKELYVNGRPFSDIVKDALKDIQGVNHRDTITLFKGQKDPSVTPIFPPDAGNRDNYGTVRVPAPGDTLQFTDSNRDNWYERFQIILYEGHKIKRSYHGETIEINVQNLNNWWESKNSFYGNNQWKDNIDRYPIESFTIDDHSLKGYTYTIKNRHYFMMGDNRDNSLDSRYWGFLPERNVVGEGLIIYWSWDKETPVYRLLHKVRWERIFDLIH